MKISLLPRTAFYTNNSALMLFLLVRSFLSFLRKKLFTYQLYNVIKRYCWQFNIWQTLSLHFLTSPDTGPTNLVSNNFEIFTLLKDDFCSVRLLHSKMWEKSPRSRSHASNSNLNISETNVDICKRQTAFLIFRGIPCDSLKNSRSKIWS